MRLCDKKLGLLINFNVPYLREGIKRMILWKVGIIGWLLTSGIFFICVSELCLLKKSSPKYSYQ
jgi:hypothetical protein